MKSDEYVAKRAGDLRAELTKFAYEYYVLDAPSVDDAVYDSLFAELKQIEKEHPDLIAPDSPTQRVASKPLDKFEKYTHRTRMISILDTFSDDEAREWFTRIEKLDARVARADFWVDTKKDGLACALHYRDGVLDFAVTRGDGFVGEVVTENVKTIPSVPLRLNASSSSDLFRGPSENIDSRNKSENDKIAIFAKGHTEIRGEIIMWKDDFAELNARQKAENKPEFANPRNLAAGTIRQLDPKITASRKLHFMPYDLIRDDANEVPTNEFAYEIFAKLGFIARPDDQKYFANFNEVLNFAKNIFPGKIENLPYNVDGLVIKLNNRELYDSLGIVGKNPRGVIAYKYPAETATTTIRDIVISLGRTGAATPVAVFDPVVLAGTTVQHASLHNADEIERLDARIGDTAVIFKAGEIIPQIKSILTDLRPELSMSSHTASKDARLARRVSNAPRSDAPFSLPEKTSSNSKQYLYPPFDFEKALKEQYPELEFERPDGEAVYRVKNFGSSKHILARAVQHFASRGALDIENLGEKNVEQLVKLELLKDLADMYALKMSDLENLDGWGKLSAENLLTAVNSAKNPPLAKFIYALGIRHVGSKTASDLAQHFGAIDQLGAATEDELTAVDGVGKIVAQSLLGWFADADNATLLAKFRELGVRPHAEKVGQKLAGQSFAITGTLESMSRDAAADKIRASGGEFQTSVGKSTTFLVAGDPSKLGHAKREKAEQFGTKVISEGEFLALVR